MLRFWGYFLSCFDSLFPAPVVFSSTHHYHSLTYHQITTRGRLDLEPLRSHPSFFPIGICSTSIALSPVSHLSCIAAHRITFFCASTHLFSYLICCLSGRFLGGCLIRSCRHQLSFNSPCLVPASRPATHVRQVVAACYLPYSAVRPKPRCRLLSVPRRLSPVVCRLSPHALTAEDKMGLP